MKKQHFTVKYEEIVWTNEYEGWTGVFQTRTENQILTLHFASDTHSRLTTLPSKGMHVVRFLRGTLKSLKNERWEERGLMHPSQVHDSPLDNDLYYNTPAVVQIV